MTASTATADTPLRQASMRLVGMLAGRLAARGLDVLFQVRLSRKRLRVGVPIALLHAMGPNAWPLGGFVTNRHEQCGLANPDLGGAFVAYRPFAYRRGGAQGSGLGLW